MYKSFFNNKELVKDVSVYLHLDPLTEEIVDIFEDEDGTFVETRVAEMGFRDDGCLQSDCEKESCLNCLARQERRDYHRIK